MQTNELSKFFPSDNSNSTADTTGESSVYFSNSPTADKSERPQAQSFSANIAKFYQFRQRPHLGLA